MSVLEHDGSLVMRRFDPDDPLPNPYAGELPVNVVRPYDEAVVDVDAGIEITDPIHNPQAVRALGWATIKKAS